MTRRAGTANISYWAKSGEYVRQATAIGPSGVEYNETKDDPRAVR
jgi:hypothetical protein